MAPIIIFEVKKRHNTLYSKSICIIRWILLLYWIRTDVSLKIETSRGSCVVNFVYSLYYGQFWMLFHISDFIRVVRDCVVYYNRNWLLILILWRHYRTDQVIEQITFCIFDVESIIIFLYEFIYYSGDREQMFGAHSLIIFKWTLLNITL